MVEAFHRATNQGIQTIPQALVASTRQGECKFANEDHDGVGAADADTASLGAARFLGSAVLDDY